VEAIVFKLEIVNYQLGRTKTANVEDPTSRTTPQSATAATVKPQATRLPLQLCGLAQPPLQTQIRRDNRKVLWHAWGVE